MPTPSDAVTQYLRTGTGLDKANNPISKDTRPKVRTMASGIDVINDQHIETTKLSTHEMVRQLNSHLGPTLVAALANVRDRKLPSRWASADGPEPRPDSKSRLIMAHRVWALISTAESEYVARAWFIGANPRLDEMSPIMKLREGEEAAVMAAARAFVEGTDD